ncbi:hypothetical protein [Tenacibaculum ovolyticum]|jgi:hypothetical protein|uniref:hypothetical protein n=1 Tax=Tenacibaculum ovolyticum TaxID=104270 RepID=UPI0004025AB3|nr:hypothetical protein [Tenacibaculum ovolyticum]
MLKNISKLGTTLKQSEQKTINGGQDAIKCKDDWCAKSPYHAAQKCCWHFS